MQNKYFVRLQKLQGDIFIFCYCPQENRKCSSQPVNDKETMKAKILKYANCCPPGYDLIIFGACVPEKEFAVQCMFPRLQSQCVGGAEHAFVKLSIVIKCS